MLLLVVNHVAHKSCSAKVAEFLLARYSKTSKQERIELGLQGGDDVGLPM